MGFFSAESAAYKWMPPGSFYHWFPHIECREYTGNWCEAVMSTDTRALEACQGAVAKLRSQGIKHGDINK
ncbi:hypothetical protein GGR56DRAFT_656912 [Xylariaceae sp. FL0804]|nr:hypothetical protein GGR56DRAFT_656912 [Xylariaceae sp. FL0804]